MPEVTPTPGRGRLSSRGRSVPQRTCVGCRERAAQSDLLRLVAAGGEIVPDPHRRLPGRGAYVHPDLECLELAERRRAFPRALRLEGPLDTRVLRARVTGGLAAKTPGQQDGTTVSDV